MKYSFNRYGLDVDEDMEMEEFSQSLYNEVSTHCDETGENEFEMFKEELANLLQGKTVVYGNEYCIEKDTYELELSNGEIMEMDKDYLLDELVKHMYLSKNNEEADDWFKSTKMEELML